MYRSKDGETERDLLDFERQAMARGYVRIAGVDEVGRGPLAGPVVAAAVVLPSCGCDLPVDDSKVLSAKRREELVRQLYGLPGVQIATSTVSVARIDRLNILRATHEAMRDAVRQLDPPPDFALIDGRPVPQFPAPCQALVKGDSRSASIAAASIIAKVYRDALMIQLDAQYPGYGFAQHKGYGTTAHLTALQRLGPSPVHRQSFGPVKRLLTARAIQLELELAEMKAMQEGPAQTTRRSPENDVRQA